MPPGGWMASPRSQTPLPESRMPPAGSWARSPMSLPRSVSRTRRLEPDALTPEPEALAEGRIPPLEWMPSQEPA